MFGENLEISLRFVIFEISSILCWGLLYKKLFHIYMTERAFYWEDVSTLKNWGVAWGRRGVRVQGMQGGCLGRVGSVSRIVNWVYWVNWGGILFKILRSNWQQMQNGSKWYILHHLHKKHNNYEDGFINTVINQKILLNFIQIQIIFWTFLVEATSFFWRSWLFLEIFLHHTLC